MVKNPVAAARGSAGRVRGIIDMQSKTNAEPRATATGYPTFHTNPGNRQA
jgi:hypothetical protein